jgi:hypothetical protein
VVISTSFISQLFGSIAATVNNPRGGKIAFLEMNFSAFLKLQKVAGASGLTSNIFIIAPPLVSLDDRAEKLAISFQRIMKSAGAKTGGPAFGGLTLPDEEQLKYPTERM